jgi:D-tyrosyl-tRNA(Tyr) deacylase
MPSALPEGRSGRRERIGIVRAVVSRVSGASVSVDGEVVGSITEPGLLVLLGVTHEDGPGHAETMARKLHELRILRGEESAASAGAPLLVVSQFTLYGDTRKGRRPTWIAAARPEHAEPLVEAVVTALRNRGARVEVGRFRAAMAVESVNDGPFTVLVEV